jgi:hypothetical protein
MGDRVVLVVEVSGAFPEAQARVHGIGIHHQVVVVAVEQAPVAEQVGDAPAQVGQPEALELGVAGDHRHVDAVPPPGFRMGQEGGQGGIGAHGGDARHEARVDAPAGDFQRQAFDHSQATGSPLAEALAGHRPAQGGRRGAHQGAAAPLQQVEKVGQGGVQVIGKEAGARAGQATRA